MNERWVKAALVRAAKTMAETAAAMIGTGAIGILDVDWLNVLSVSVTAGILSILMSIRGLPETYIPEVPVRFEDDDEDEEEDDE